MSATTSNMMSLGTIAPDFNLINPVTNTLQNLQTLKGAQGTLIIFMCNHCPYVLHLKEALIQISTEYARQGIEIIAINANDTLQYPDDSPTKMIELMQQWGQPFKAYLHDDSQATAKAYQAACTPDFYLFNQSLQCVYRGRFDAATPKNNIPITGNDLRSALENLLNNNPQNSTQIPSIGCNIKWK
jgi:thiol-disulfide isomerase/thioredoxin